MNRTNRYQFENGEGTISGVIEGLTVVALLCPIVSLIPQVGSGFCRNCGASNKSFGTFLKTITLVTMPAGLSSPRRCSHCLALHYVIIFINSFRAVKFQFKRRCNPGKTVVLSIKKMSEVGLLSHFISSELAQP